MSKSKGNAPTGANSNPQVIDNIELTNSENAPTVQNIAISSSEELIGAIKHQKRINQISEATLIIELSKVQQAYRSKSNPHLTASADSFKEFVEVECGLVYGTIRNKITHLNSIGPQLLHMFEQLGVPVTLQRQIKALPTDLREQLDDALAGSPAQSADKVAEVFKRLTAHTITLQDKLDESETKTKVEIIDERDQAKKHYELVEDRMIQLNEKNEILQTKVKTLLASKKPDEQALGIRKINDQMEVYFKTLSEADFSGDDLAILAEKLRFQKLIDKASDLGIK
ncbi:MAG: hypothetical protein H8E26_14255 [FCB group bacterium]|nr:hypothetical protein [FCB group bacterium]MBL7027447.1 hypothetical protein [Candidatus Neomarinimicrobiota bacterium]MBL7122060.1 hypothetical protein [Candidatus Neomarinimicrobiota bacterium]